MRDKNVRISGPFIIEKVLQFAKALGYDEFRGSNGWLENFKGRYGIMAKVISGESKDIDDNDSEHWITETLSKILKDYKPENIFNADELREKEEINGDVLIDDFLSLDSGAETSETLTELDILDRVKNKNNTAKNCDEDGNDRDAEIKPPNDEMLKSFETIRRTV
ncbi:hypothetical protein AVEN_44058-1 [Araneus ventricosus]|uniref:HTH CENPB-type domain-containing protein n=1 Tax=Araneus ventricosus TaxID=182803 RepID=A0A4Y2HAI0_ARAVE|nr:hypothetical protein AVEN_44058-1 [Araneus ventricosus]